MIEADDISWTAVDMTEAAGTLSIVADTMKAAAISEAGMGITAAVISTATSTIGIARTLASGLAITRTVTTTSRIITDTHTDTMDMGTTVIRTATTTDTEPQESGDRAWPFARGCEVG
jgi:hypothetical protein